MKYNVEKLVDMINKEIGFRRIENFIEEFADDTMTYKFVSDCTINNQLDLRKVREWGNNALDYMYNIARFWLGLHDTNIEVVK